MRGVEDYLEEIKRLEEDGERITATVLARILEVSLPSASEMLKRLAGEGYLTREQGGAILLTPEGRRLAHTMLRRHRLVECLVALDHLPEDEALPGADLHTPIVTGAEERTTAARARPPRCG